jgi:hypothetical protein
LSVFGQSLGLILSICSPYVECKLEFQCSCCKIVSTEGAVAVIP